MSVAFLRDVSREVELFFLTQFPIYGILLSTACPYMADRKGGISYENPN